MDKQAFKQRMQNLKSYRENNPGKGYWDWRNSLPDNLKYTDDTEYDMVGAYNSGAQPTLEDDGSYHLPTRVPSTGKILKSSIHPTYWKGLAEDEKLGYHTYWLPDGSTYTASKYDAPIQAFADGGEVDEFQRKTRRDIMQESLVDGRPDYNKMFQNQNEYQKDFANYWYTERAKNPKYSDQIGGDKLSSVLSNIDKATWKTPTEAMRDNMVGQGYNPTDAQINQQLNILKEKGTKGFANPKAHSYTSLRPANTWHEGIGHMVGDNTTAILNATPNVHISNPDSSYEDYANQANEKHAQTWDFRGNNSNLKDDQGNYYIDPNRQLTPEDISNMRSKGAKIPEQWESLKDADISELTNTFAYNLSQDPIYYMANGGEIGDEEIKYLSNWYNKRRTYAKHRIPAMNKQLDRIDYYLKPSKYRKTIYDTPITISNDKVKQASDKDDRGEYGGYYHPNEGVVLPDNYKEWKDREPLLHELNHVVNTFNLPVFNQINSILKDKQIIDRGDKVNQYLTTPSEVQSRLMEFRKLNNLDPLKVYGIPDVREWRRSGMATLIQIHLNGLQVDNTVF